VMLGWWRGQSNCLCSMYNVFCMWSLNRKKSMCDIWRDSLIMCVFLK
jgi:hypothetical protein